MKYYAAVLIAMLFSVSNLEPANMAVASKEYKIDHPSTDVHQVNKDKEKLQEIRNQQKSIHENLEKLKNLVKNRCNKSRSTK